jgi:hypothetical protein
MANEIDALLTGKPQTSAQAIDIGRATSGEGYRSA